ncbi:MAG: RidA family protein [Firmicutes bacterium]|nr:RidA family protein [Bacillota bacterium]
MSIYDVLKEKGIVLPPAPAKGGVYAPAKEFGDKLVYISGCGCNIGDEIGKGKLGKEMTIEEGQKWARNCMLNVLSVVDANVGLDNVKSCVKILAFVASDPDFYDQPAVANSASNLLMEVFGDVPSRSAVGMVSLPGNMPIEIEAIFELK